MPAAEEHHLSTAHRFDGARELSDNTVASATEHPAMMARNQPFHDLSVGAWRAGSRFLVSLHEPAVADHVGGKDRGQTSLHARFLLVRRLPVINEGIHAERNYPNVGLMGCRPKITLVRDRVGDYVSSMAPRIFLLVGLALVLVTALAGGANPTAAQFPLQTFERDELTIETAEGARHRFEVELALSREQRAQGLMYRRSLAENAGMLFVYGKERPVSMWMKNTLIPLDILFIRRDGRIARIAGRAVPRSLQTISSGRPVAAVLELNGGTAARFGIQPGDRVQHPAVDGGA